MDAPDSTPPPLRAMLPGAALLLTGVVVTFHRLVFGGEILVGRDTLLVYYPLAKFWADRVRALDFPEWYPYDALGQPFIGMVISGALHPSKLMYLLLPLGPAHGINTLLCYPFAALGVYLCGRELKLGRDAALLGAITYALSGYLVDISNNFLYLLSAATFPWVLWASHRFLERPTPMRLLTAGALHASILFAGDPQSFAVTGAGVLLLGLAPSVEASLRTRIGRTALLLALAAMLSTPQLLPALHTRSGALEAQADPAIAQVYSLHPLRLLELVLGPLLLDPGADLPGVGMAAAIEPHMKNLWVGSVGVGALGIVLACVGLWAYRRSRLTPWFALAGLVIGMLALGRHTPLYGWVYELLPPWRSFRFPEKLTPFALFLIALAAAAGASTLATSERVRRRAGVSALLLAVVLLLVTATTSWWSSLIVASAGAGTANVELVAGQLFKLSLICAIGLAAAGGLLFSGRMESVSVTGLCALQAAALVIVHAPLPQTTSLDVLTEPSPFLATISADEGRLELGGPRVLSAATNAPDLAKLGLSPLDSATAYLTAALRPATPALFGLETSNYYLPAPSTRVFLGYRADGIWLKKLAWLYGTRYATVDTSFAARVAPEHVLERIPALGLGLLRRPDARPRAYLAEARCVGDAEAALSALAEGPPLGPTEAWIECQSPEAQESTAPASSSLGTITAKYVSPEQVDLKVAAARVSHLVLNDAFYEGWSAQLDDNQAVILPANLAVRAVRVPQGRHTVRFEYRAPGFRTGLAIMMFALVVVLAFEWRRRHRPATVTRDDP